MNSPRVLLADKASPALNRLAKALHKNKLQVEIANDLPTAHARYAQSTPDVVVVGSATLGLLKALKAHDPAVVGLALVGDQKSRRAAQRAGADTSVMRPATPQTVEAAVRALALLRGLRVAQTQGSGTPIFDPSTGFYAFEHFKQALFVEVKRAKRHQLPIALILASISVRGREDDPEVRPVLMGGLALAVRGATRDSDLPVAYGRNNVMVLLPHTEAAGAEAVARRVLFRIARSSVKRMKPSLSLGLAASDGTQPFSELVHLASVRLREAELRGGNCLVAG